MVANWQLYRSFLHEPDTIDSVASPGGERLRENFRRVTDALIARGLCVTDTPYGADATGSVDATDIIQAAIDDAGDAGGGVVLIPWGTYKVTGTALSVPSRVSVISYGAVLQTQAGRDTPVIDIDGAADVYLAGFSITKASGTAAAAGSYGVYVRGDSSDVVVERVTVDALFRPFQIAGGEGTVAGTCRRITLRCCSGLNAPQQFGFNVDDTDTITFDTCYARGNGLDGFKLRKKARNVSIRGGASTDNGTFAAGDGIDCYAGGDTVEVDGIYLATNSGSGITVKTGSFNIDPDDPAHPENTADGENSARYGYVRNVILRNLRTYQNTENGVYLTISDPGNTDEPLVNGCVIDGGYFEGDTIGLYLNARNVSVNHPFVRKTQQHGIQTSAQAFDVEINDALIVAAGQAADNTYHGIVIGGSSNVRVNRGLVVGKDGDQIHSDADLTALSTNRTRYGCDIQPTSTAIQVRYLRGRQIVSNIVNNQAASAGIVIDQLRGGDPEGAAFGVIGSTYRRDYVSIGEDGYKVWKVKTRGQSNSVGGTAGTVQDWAWWVQGAPVSALPTADASLNGLILRLEGGSGVADGLYVCLKAAGGTFSWKLIVAG